MPASDVQTAAEEARRAEIRALVARGRLIEGKVFFFKILYNFYVFGGSGFLFRFEPERAIKRKKNPRPNIFEG